MSNSEKLSLMADFRGYLNLSEENFYPFFSKRNCTQEVMTYWWSPAEFFSRPNCLWYIRMSQPNNKISILICCKYYSRASLKFVVVLFICGNVFAIWKEMICSSRIDDDLLGRWHEKFDINSTRSKSFMLTWSTKAKYILWVYNYSFQTSIRRSFFLTELCYMFNFVSVVTPCL